MKLKTKTNVTTASARCRVKAWSAGRNGGFLRFFGEDFAPKSRFLASIGYQADTQPQSVRVKYRLIDGYHVYTSEDVYGLYVANRDAEKAYRAVGPSLEKLIELNREGQMGEPLDTDRLVWGGSLYPPPDDPPHHSRRLSVVIIVLAALAAWVIVCLLAWPVLAAEGLPNAVLQTGYPPPNVDRSQPVQWQGHDLACYWPKPDENGDRHDVKCRILDGARDGR